LIFINFGVSSIKNSVQLKYNYQYFFTITGSKSGLEKEGSCIESRYGHIQQSIVRAEVFAGKMKSTHSVAVIPTL
jgi:hypothetical protein